MMRFLVRAACVAWVLWLLAWSRSGGEVVAWEMNRAPRTTVGPSAMLEWQRQGATVLDARRSGRYVSHTTKASGAEAERLKAAGGPLLVIAESEAEASRVSARAMWVPAKLLEIPLRPGVRQVKPRQLFEAARRGEVEVIDVSEAHEWQWERLPFGRRVDWMRVVSGDRSWVPRGKKIVFACRLGGRSQAAAAMLAREGFATSNLSGGVWAWQGCGLPTASGKSRGGADG